METGENRKVLIYPTGYIYHLIGHGQTTACGRSSVTCYVVDISLVQAGARRLCMSCKRCLVTQHPIRPYPEPDRDRA